MAPLKTGLNALPMAVDVAEVGRRFLPGLNRGEIHCRFEGGKLRVRSRAAWLERHVQVLTLIADALASLGVRSLPPFYMLLGDTPSRRRHRYFRTRFAFSQADGYGEVAAPDFVFDGWPDAKFDDYDRKTRAMAAASEEPPRDDRLFWAGRCMNGVRRRIVEIASVRPDLVEAYDTEQNYDVAINRYSTRFRTMEDQVATYRYMIDVEGAGYSGRFKMLLHTKRVVLLQDRPWREWFFDDIEPFRHYVPVARDLSDLTERIEWLRANPKMETEIAAEARHFAQTRLTRAAAVAAWAKLLQDHAAAGGNLKSGLQRRKRATGWPD
ncbi:glycosyl transferase family 90 [Mesorhizobium sp. B2-4-15]|uniref:glycosyl transferase family 90 n=1 Tax=Mesorhizobium sp. B2-4-15 TaxID=2589934 RepID=UPI0015EEE01B|nr:glycosyl transferase family 90 [Mesorhizobium sp. B2-4-15]